MIGQQGLDYEIALLEERNQMLGGTLEASIVAIDITILQPAIDPLPL